MRSSFRFLLPVFALTGCATGPSLQSRMAAYIGDNTQTLVQSLGVPDKQITVNGSQYLAYVRRYDVLSPGYLSFGGGGYGGPFYGSGFGGPFYDFPPYVSEYSCETTFLLRDDRVLDFTMRGNDCS
jgi:hypothetical protein